MLLLLLTGFFIPFSSPPLLRILLLLFLFCSRYLYIQFYSIIIILLFRFDIYIQIHFYFNCIIQSVVGVWGILFVFKLKINPTLIRKRANIFKFVFNRVQNVFVNLINAKYIANLFNVKRRFADLINVLRNNKYFLLFNCKIDK